MSQSKDALLSVAVDGAPDLIFLLDRDGSLRFVNDRVKEFLGYEKAELTGLPYSRLVLAEDLDRARELFQGLSGSMVRRAHLRFMPKPGAPAGENPVWLEVAVARADEAGSLPASDGAGADMAARPGTDEAGDLPAYGRFSGVCVVARNALRADSSEDAMDLPANRDALTGLANRAFFEQCLGAALKKRRRGDKKLAVMFIDLDGFKIINDTLGHAGGDRLLSAVAARLRASLRPGDILARFGGDEFTLFLSDIRTRTEAVAVATKILRQLDVTFAAGAGEVRLGASIGIALHPGAGDTVETLLDNADTAMYCAKRAGHAYRFYRAGLSRPAEPG